MGENNEFLMAQDLVKTESGYVRGGFNMRLHGDSISDLNDCKPSAPYNQGYWLADKMINDGKIFYTGRFKCECGSRLFTYGAGWHCTCGRTQKEKKWWIIKVFKDGNAWCCIGLGFENLQESDNYAFGNSRQDAINAYEKIMILKEQSHD